MTRIFIVLLLVLTLTVLMATPTFAQACGPNVYFDQTNGSDTDPAYNGTFGAPFQTQAKAEAALFAQSAYGCVIEILPGGKWIVRQQVPPTTPGTGVPLPTPVFYTLALVVAIGLIAGGWWLQRRNSASPAITAGG